MPPHVRLEVPSITKAKAEGVEAGTADADAWPVRVVRRGLRRRVALELAGEDRGVGVLDEAARPRLARTVTVLGTFFDEFQLGAGRAMRVEPLTPERLAELVAGHGLEADRHFRVEPDPPPPRRPEPDVEGVEAVDAAWDRIERWLAANHPAGAGALSPGADDAAIEAAERRVGRPFPEALRASLRRHDGQPDGVYAIADGHELLSAEGVASEWEMLAEIRTEDLDDADEWWRPSWIPFTRDGSGQAYCVDADTGAVVEFIHDDTHEPSARRLEGWLMRWAEELEAGEQVLDPEDGIVVAAWLLRD